MEWEDFSITVQSTGQRMEYEYAVVGTKVKVRRKGASRAIAIRMDDPRDKSEAVSLAVECALGEVY